MGLKSWFTTGDWNSERSTSPNDDWLAGKWDVFNIGGAKSGKTISKQNALTISGVYAAVRVYSDAISSLPVHLMRDTGTTREKFKKHPVYPLLSREPNSLMTVNTYWKIVMQELLLWGNSFSIIEFAQGSFRPISLLPVHPSRVKVDIVDGVLWYTVAMENAKDLVIDQSNMLHFRGMGDTVMGKSVIDCAKENLELGAAAEEFGNRFFGNGA